MRKPSRKKITEVLSRKGGAVFMDGRNIDIGYIHRYNPEHPEWGHKDLCPERPIYVNTNTCGADENYWRDYVDVYPECISVEEAVEEIFSSNMHKCWHTDEHDLKHHEWI